MKIILSRKGFDSGSGGYANPILKDGSLVSLPIPDAGAPLRYGDCRYGTRNMGTLVEKITRKKIKRSHRAHLDPDVDPKALKERPEMWRPLFGQHGAAQGHLAKCGVGVGDLFLFFGWFREFDGTRFVKDAPDIHAFFGYFQVGEVHVVDEGLAPEWMHYHPHFHGKRSGKNVVYVASENLVLGEETCDLGGAGLFPKMKPDLQLTREGQRRGIWTLPRFFRTQRQCLSYHGNTERWRALDAEQYELDSAYRGQEFVLDLLEAEQEAMAWVKELITSGTNP